MRESQNRSLGQMINWKLIACYILICIFGIVNIYASIQSSEPSSIFEFGSRSGKQIMWFGISILAAVLILFVFSPRLWEVMASPSYFFVMVLLVAVIFLSRDVKGSHSWFSLGPVSFQPCEVSKITTSLMLAAMMSRYTWRFSKFKHLLYAAAVVGVPMLIIIAESETGSALVYVGYLFVLYREGLSGWFITILGIMIFIFILTLVTSTWISMIAYVVMVTLIFLRYINHIRNSVRFRVAAVRALLISLVVGMAFIFSVRFAFDHVLQDHQRTRIEVLLGMKEDLHGAGYNVHQSLIAIGSGGFSGKGFLEGTQTANGFVPEQSTDFIFCTVGEEWGFLGCMGLIVLYGLMIFWIVQAAEESREKFTRIYGYCVASIFFMHLFINIGMTIGLMPVIGIPLPFMSYGGSSLLSFTVMLFIFIALDKQEKKYF